MQLENPRQQRRLNQVIASMPDAGMANLASRLVKFERTVRQSRHDAEVVEAVVRILEHPAHQRLADKLRHLITKGTTHEANAQ